MKKPNAYWLIAASALAALVFGLATPALGS